MEIRDFISKYAEIFDETSEDELQPQTNFRELDEWSSLLALSTMAMVNEEYDVELTADEMLNAQTIEDLYNTVKSHLS